jgi:hypothetical protein
VAPEFLWWPRSHCAGILVGGPALRLTGNLSIHTLHPSGNSFGARPVDPFKEMIKNPLLSIQSRRTANPAPLQPTRLPAIHDRTPAKSNSRIPTF